MNVDGSGGHKILMDLLEVSEIGVCFLYHRQGEQVQRE